VLKMTTLIVRHPSLTKEAFEQHHREIHAPLFAATRTQSEADLMFRSITTSANGPWAAARPFCVALATWPPTN
jgi:hypothetical protein